MKTIYRKSIRIGFACEVELPMGSKILHVSQDEWLAPEEIHLHILYNVRSELEEFVYEKRTFLAFNHSHEITESMVFVGAAPRGWGALYVFEIT